MTFTIYSISLLIAGLIAGFTSIISFSRTGTSVHSFAYMMAGVTIWAIAYAFELASGRMADMLFWIKIEYIGIALIPAFWLLFCIRYTEYDKFLNRLTQPLLFLMPIATLLLVWTNDYHHLHYARTSVTFSGGMTLLNIEPGIWYRVHTVVFYGYLITGIGLLLKKYRVTSSLFRPQINSILLGAAIPWAANIAYLTGFRPFGHLDITPYAFVLTGVFISAGLLRFRLFEILPVAREKIIEEMNEGILILDKRFMALDANPAFEQIMGAPDSGYLGKPVQELFRNVESMIQVIESGTAGSAEMKMNNDGKDRFIEVSVKPLINTSGLINGYFLIFRDVTRNKQLETDLISTVKEAEAANRAKSEFLANMSHEIRTPLNGVIGFIDLLMKTKMSSVQRQYMSSAYLSANSLLDIINDILDFSKIEAGKLDLSVEITDLRELCEQSADIVSWQIKDQNLDMILSVDPNVPEVVLADAVRLRQILVNLLSNALKFTPRGEIELRVLVLEKKDANSQKFRFSVRDTGIGIEKKNRKKIFDAFAQQDFAITRKYSGTGLGLTISNKLLSLMNSSLKLNSKPGEGSTFYFDITLECPETDPAEDRKRHMLSTKRMKESTDYGPLKNSIAIPDPLILVADDNPVNTLLVTSIISRLLPDARVKVANNGRIAVEMYREEQPDLIYMDIRMPEMSGYEATRQIRLIEGDRRVPIIALTAGTVKGEKEKCLNIGMDDYITKPFVLETIGSSLKKWLNYSESTFMKQQNELFSDADKHFDLKRLKENLDLDDNSVKEILEVAEENLGSIFTEIENAVKNGRAKALTDAAHKLKGTSGTLCFDLLADMARNLEKSSDPISEETLEMIRSIEKEIKQVRTLIQATIS